MFSAKVKNVTVYPMGEQFLCFALVERPELAKIVYKGPAENVMLLITHPGRLEFSHSTEPRTTTYKGAKSPQLQVFFVFTYHHGAPKLCGKF